MTAGPQMRTPSPLEQMHRLESALNGPDPAVRLRAARRIFALGSPNRPGSRMRMAAIDVLGRRHSVEDDAEVRGQLRAMLDALRSNTTMAAVPSRTTDAVPAQPVESEMSRMLRRMAGAAIARALGPLSFVASLQGCGWDYSVSVMEGETGLVREFTQDLIQGETTVEGRVRRIVEWGQRSLPHYHDEFTASVYDPDRTSCAADPTIVSIRDVFRERVVGCHLAAFTLITMMKSVGIDAEYVRSEDIGAGDEGHGIIHIPAIDRYVHGDSVCMLNIYPTEDIIIDRDTLVRSDASRMAIETRNNHAGGFLRREGNTLYLDGVVHAGYEDTEFPRLRAMFPEFDIQPGGPYQMDPEFGTGFTSRRVPIVPLE